jgi:hypothetical protein
MSSLRKLEREIIRTKAYQKKGNTSSFKEDWNTYRTTKFGENNIPKSTTKKKQRHNDSKDSFIGALKYQKEMIKAYLDGLKNKKEDTAEAAE